MKTKTFFLLCLFTGFGLTQLSAQNGNDVGRDMYPEWVPVFSSDGDQIDLLSGYIPYHYVWHSQHGVTIWVRSSFSGEVESVGFVNDDGEKIGGTGERFIIKDQFNGDYNGTSVIGGGHFTARGNLGSHYIIFYEYYWDIENEIEEITFVKAVSPGSKE